MTYLTKERSVDFLRCVLGIVFLWSGIFKILDQSTMVFFIGKIFPLFPEPMFLHLLGIWEILIGFALIARVLLPLTFVMIWVNTLFTFITAVVFPAIFFSNNPLFVSLQSESLILALIIFAASLVVASHELKSICLVHYRKGHYWFKPFKMGIVALYYPVKFPGYVLTGSLILALVSFFMIVDATSHSNSDTLIRFAPYFITCLLIYDVFTRVTGLYPWWWKKKCDCKNFY